MISYTPDKFGFKIFLIDIQLSRFKLAFAGFFENKGNLIPLFKNSIFKTLDLLLST